MIMEARPGISGFTKVFREAMADLPDGARVVFTGSIGVCTPFAELLAYSVKDRDFDLVYLPAAVEENAKRMRWVEGVGFTVLDEYAYPRNPYAIVVLGGLAMPKFGVSPEYLERVIASISGDREPKLVGVGFMSVFERNGWVERFGFDVAINAHMETTIR
jgi:hypothetical protein